MRIAPLRGQFLDGVTSRACSAEPEETETSACPAHQAFTEGRRAKSIFDPNSLSRITRLARCDGFRADQKIVQAPRAGETAVEAGIQNGAARLEPVKCSFLGKVLQELLWTDSAEFQECSLQVTRAVPKTPGKLVK